MKANMTRRVVYVFCSIVMFCLAILLLQSRHHTSAKAKEVQQRIFQQQQEERRQEIAQQEEKKKTAKRELFLKAKKMLSDHGVSFDTEALGQPDWRQRLKTDFGRMPEMKLDRAEGKYLRRCCMNLLFKPKTSFCLVKCDCMH